MTDSTTNSATYTIQPTSVVAATPTFNPSSGNYSGSQSVTISCSTNGATIRYTLDGSEPTSSSTTYSGPIAVNTGTVTIKAKAFMSGMTNSSTASATYRIVRWVTHLHSIYGCASRHSGHHSSSLCSVTALKKKEIARDNTNQCRTTFGIKL